MLSVAPEPRRRCVSGQVPCSPSGADSKAIHAPPLAAANGGAGWESTGGRRRGMFLPLAATPGLRIGSTARTRDHVFAIGGPQQALPSHVRRRVCSRARSAVAETTCRAQADPRPQSPGPAGVSQGAGALIAEALSSRAKNQTKATLEIDRPSLPVDRGAPSSPPPRGRPSGSSG